MFTRYPRPKRHWGNQYAVAKALGDLKERFFPKDHSKPPEKAGAKAGKGKGKRGKAKAKGKGKLARKSGGTKRKRAEDGPVIEDDKDEDSAGKRCAGS
eukprot:15452644-Alexandrium_andersonii.AAC.1